MRTRTFAPGDHNLNGAEVAEHIATRKGDRVWPAKAYDGTFVDSLIARHAGALHDAFNLGRMGSDAHDAILWVFEGWKVMTWNVYVGNDPANVRQALNGILKEHHPDQISLQEVAPATLVVLARWASENGFWIERGDRAGDMCVVLVAQRLQRKLLGKGRLRMLLGWVGPKLGIKKNPRTYPVIRVKDKRVKVRATSLHGPTGGLNGPNAKAVREYCRRTRRWLHRAR